MGSNCFCYGGVMCAPDWIKKYSMIKEQQAMGVQHVMGT
jgi:hypothetical protein